MSKPAQIPIIVGGELAGAVEALFTSEPIPYRYYVTQLFFGADPYCTRRIPYVGPANETDKDRFIANGQSILKHCKPEDNNTTQWLIYGIIDIRVGPFEANTCLGAIMAQVGSGTRDYSILFVIEPVGNDE